MMVPLAFVVPLFVIVLVVSVILVLVDGCIFAKGGVVGVCVCAFVFVLVLLVFHRMVVLVSLLGHTMTRPGRMEDWILAMGGNRQRRRRKGNCCRC